MLKASKRKGRLVFVFLENNLEREIEMIKRGVVKVVYIEGLDVEGLILWRVRFRTFRGGDMIFVGV